MCVFFVKQETGDERRISDWSSDVCSPISWQCPCRHQCTTWRVPCPHFAFAFHIVASSARAHPMRQWRGLLRWRPQLGRESCRVRVCQYEYLSVVAVSSPIKQIYIINIRQNHLLTTIIYILVHSVAS